MIQTEKIDEVVFQYEAAEYHGWKAGTSHAGLLTRCGYLGRRPSTYDLQRDQNYPEVRYAVHLVEDEKFPSDHVFYENYLLSEVALKSAGTGSGGLTQEGASVVRQVFSTAFSRLFDQLCDRNPSLVAGKTREGMRVDLFAADIVRRRARIVECKKYSPQKIKTEKVQQQQLAVLAFTRYAIQKLGNYAFVGKPFDVRADLIAFVEKTDWALGRILQPPPHELRFYV